MTETHAPYRVPGNGHGPAAAPEPAPAPGFEDTVGALQTVRESEDATAWHVGDTTHAYLGQFRRGLQGAELERLAHATGYLRATLRERRDTARYWPAETRSYGPVISFSHYNRARRGHTLAEAQEWLDKAEEFTWSIAELEYQIARAEGQADPEPTWDELVDKALDLLRQALEIKGVRSAARTVVLMVVEALEGAQAK